MTRRSPVGGRGADGADGRAASDQRSADAPRRRAALLAWYDRNRRDLPWRGGGGSGSDAGAYRIWVSEVMLQQTRVEAVKPYFSRWMEQFPTLEALARAPLDEVLKAWEGLGYYSRARNFHSAARRLVGETGRGEVPRDPSAFRALPGVGRYTAGAVMSIAFDLPEPVVDGNVRRVFARWMDLAEPREPELWRLATELVHGERPGDLNQSLMELGATVCTPRKPSCEACPVSDGCLARGAGTQEQRPLPRKRSPLPHERTAVAVVRRGSRFLLARRPVDVRLGGMWEFPSTLRGPGEAAEHAAERALLQGVGLVASAGGHIGSVDHVFTHVRVTYEAIRCKAATGEPRPILYDDFAWVTSDGLSRYALPAAQKRILALSVAGAAAGAEPPGATRTRIRRGGRSPRAG